jgi:ParB family chromosome partitioning protein
MEFEKRVVDLDVNDVLPNRFQPRIKFNEDSINELCESIKEHGVIQPIVVRAMGDKYEIIAGERRYKATLLAGKNTIPAVVTDLNDKDSAEVALIENVQRKDLTPIEEAISYKKILDMGYLTQDELATKLGKTQSTVANKLRLLNLDEEVQEAVLEEKISERHARSLLRISNIEDQKKMLEKIIENRLTVRKADEEINNLLSSSNTESNNEVAVVNAIPEILNESPFKMHPISKDNIPTFDSSNVVDNNVDEEPVVIIDDIDQLPVINEDQVTVNPTDDFNPFNLEAVNNETPLPVVPEEIPTNPIEVSPSLPVTMDEIKEDSIAESQINPGFMDINKIETEAKDINMTENKDIMDINSLLKPTVVGTVETETNVTPVVPEEQPAEEIKAGKFFSLPFDEDTEETSNVETPVAQVEPDNNLNSIFNFNLDSVAPVSQPVSSNSLVNNENNIATTVPNTETVIQEEPGVNVAPVSNDLLNFEADNFYPFKESSSLAESTPAVEELAAINDPSPIEVALTFDGDFSIPEDSQNETLTMAEPIQNDFDSVKSEDSSLSSSSEITTPAESLVPQGKSIASALELIRSGAKQLENMGYIIDTEEFDFENVYQIIIKIEK